MAGAVVGIDLGTTNTVVAVVRGGKATVLADENGNRLLPSVVSFHPNGEVLVGHKARERRLVDARNTVYSVKRLIGRSWASDEVERARKRFPFELREGPTHGPLVVARGETYTLPEISAFVLRRAKQIAEQALGEPVERAVVTVPASFNDLQRASTKVAAREAGLEVLRILNEPTAAALAYGFGKSGNERIAIYDFGGGTFDLTLLDLSGNVFEVIATAGDSFLGGDDVDTVIADRIAQDVIQRTRFDPRIDVQVMERLRAAAEQMKVALSTQQEMSVELKELGYGPGGAPIDVTFRMPRQELEQLAGPLVEKTFTVCRDALQLARLQVDAFDNVILVGGSTRIPLVRRRVEQFFAKKPMDRVNPDEVVAIGAAIQAAALTGAERRRQPTPAPILQQDAVKATRIQTLGGVGQKPAPEPSRIPARPPPPQRTTGRVITSPLPREEGSTPPAAPPPQPKPGVGPRTDAAHGLKMFEEALADSNSQVGKHPAPQDYPNIPGMVSAGTGSHPAFPAAPARSGATAPLVPVLHDAPPHAHAHDQPSLHDFGDPAAMPRGFPDHSPVPTHLRDLSPAPHEPSAPVAHAPPPPPLSYEPMATPPPPPLRTPPPMPVPNLRTPMPTPVPPQLAPQRTPAQVPARTQLAMQPTPPPPQPVAAPMPAPSVPPLPAPSPFAPAPFTPAPIPAQAAAAWPQANADFQAPLLIDVTPLSLAVETVGGYVDKVINRNSPVPCAQTRTFTTSKDGQQIVVIRVCQGEGEMFPQNTALGQLELSGLRAARRGEVSIEVTFELDADGILQVRARDVETRHETHAKMRLVGLDAPAARH
jgi:molecular chaperone DnaK